MSAIDDLFIEIEHHAVMHAHGTLMLNVKIEVNALRIIVERARSVIQFHPDTLLNNEEMGLADALDMLDTLVGKLAHPYVKDCNCFFCRREEQ